MTIDTELKKQIERQVKRIKKAEREQQSLIAQTVYVGTLGVLFVLPVVVGAYLGHWLDNQVAGYSVRWTISLILLGVIIGAVNVYLFIKE
jgi:ATP synthase protein I